MITLTAKSKIRISKDKCENLDDKPDDLEMFDIACSANNFSIDVGESASIDSTTICDDEPQSVDTFPGEATASATLFYSSKADSGYVKIRQAHALKEKRYMCVEFPDGGKEEFIASISSHNISLQTKEAVQANATFKISGGVKQTPAAGA